MKQKMDKFSVVILGIVFDPKNKKILIGRREKDPYIPKLTWSFPGGRATPGQDIDKTLKKVMKEKTGLIIKNLGAIFSKTYPEKKDLLSVYFLCESFEGKLKNKGKDFKEFKWVSPKELSKYFTTSFHPKLKQFLTELV